MKKKVLLNIILVIAILCFLGSGGYLLKYYWDGWQAEKKIGDLSSLILPDESDEVSGDENDPESSGEHPTDTQKPKKNRYAKLVEQNPDFIGWIEIEGTKLNYPVMYTPQEPEYYLHRNFDREYEYSGLPFVDGACTLNPRSTNVIIYGHNMKNDTMFSHLLDYQEKSYYDEHPQIIFNTIYGDATYEIVSVILSKAFYDDEEGFRYYGFTDASSEADFNEYMENIRALELYDTGVRAQYGDELLTLSTCEYSQENGRLAVIARRITEE